MTAAFQSFSEFEFVRIHNLLTDTNTVIVVASHKGSPETENALFIIRHSIWTPDAPAYLFSGIPNKAVEPAIIAEQLQQNSKFYQFLDFDKYAACASVIIRETPAVYETVTKPYIASSPEKELQWVINILEGRAEQERMIGNDDDQTNGFVLLPDTKWDQANLKALYCVGICHKRGIATVRDLTAAHIPLLQNMASKGRQWIVAKYGVRAEAILCFVHYLPSFFHFHVHYVMADSRSQFAPRSLILEDIIDNLRFNSNYYRRCSLTLIRSENDDLTHNLQVALATGTATTPAASTA